MSLNALIINTLKPLAPTSFLTYTGPASTYITFFEFNQNGSMYADDQEQNTTYSIQVNVWSKGDYTTLVDQVRNALTNIGFRRTFETEYYEDDTKTYHKVLRLNYVQ